MSVADNIGLIANCSLCVFGNPYKCANLEPVGLTESAMVFGTILRTERAKRFNSRKSIYLISLKHCMLIYRYTLPQTL